MNVTRFLTGAPHVKIGSEMALLNTLAKRVCVGCLCAAALGVYSGGPGEASAAQGEARKIRFVKNPELVPAFTLRDLNGKTLSSAGMRGKVTLLNFWATWCGPCRAEIPDLIELQQKYSDKLQIVGLSTDEVQADAVRRFVQKAGVNYRVAIATPEVDAKFGGILALPTAFLIDSEGRVVEKHIGLNDPSLYEAEIRALLGLPVDAQIETFEDTGQIFLKNAARAAKLPGVDLSKLTPGQKKVALRRLNAEGCPCGWTLTLAQCRINDTACAVSKKAANEIVRKISDSVPSHSHAARKS